MLRTLFFIPNAEIAGLPVFGRGWLLLAWAVFGVVLLVWLIRKQGAEGEVWGYLPLLVLVAAAIWFLLPRLCEPIPGRGELRGLPIRGYGAMLLVAVAAAVAMAAWRGRRMGIDPELVFTLAFWAFVPGIIGARAFYVIEYWDDFPRGSVGETLSAIIDVTQGGLVVYGSLIGAILGLAACIYRYKMPPLATLDLVAPSFVLGMAIGRLGCFLNGCCFGGVCDLPWAVEFPADSPACLHQVEHGETFVQGLKVAGESGAKPVITAVRPGSPAERQGLKPGQEIVSIDAYPVHTAKQARRELLRAQQFDAEIAIETSESESVAKWPITRPLPRSEPVHPTQIYSALNGLVLCLFLVAYAPFRRRDGVVWAMFLTLYPITRFLLEIIRTDEPGVFGMGLSISQVVSLILLVCALAFWAHIFMKPPGTAFATHQEPGKTG
ncbi:MAG TPA: prolipoprotein diacylglyceryl transferase family protein [Thermoguttaceae bacterium]|nr:prolipoprotein diacylglyceryl transferase family protein [Thermoguttaceae bacterium]